MNEKIKVLHAITRLDRGGSSENTLLSVIGLTNKGYKVDLLFGKTEEADMELLEKAKDMDIDFVVVEDLVRNIHPIKDMKAFFEIREYLKENKYDIVHTHSSKAGLVCRLAAYFSGAKNIIYTPHGHVFYGYFNKIMTRMIIFVESIWAHITDKIIGLTPAECDEWIKLGIGKSDQYIAVPSGVDLHNIKDLQDRETLKQSLGIPLDAVLVGSVGRFVGIKGYEYFIKAASEILHERDDVHFILAGDGPLAGEYKNMISKNKIEGKFHIIGWREDICSFIKALDIFVLSSLNEGMGRVLVQAMFLGKPVIATRVGGVPSVVSSDVGILVEPASECQIKEAIEILLEDKDKAYQMGVKGKQKAQAGYSVDKMVSDLDGLYKELLDRRAS